MTRCDRFHFINVWPYTTRCILDADHDTKHRDKNGDEWTNESDDACPRWLE